MEEESTLAVKIAASLGVISVVIIMAITVMHIGLQNSEKFIGQYSDIVNSATSAHLECLYNEGNKLPVATVYAVLNKYVEPEDFEENKVTVTGSIQNKQITCASDLLKHTDRKIYVKVSDGDGQVNVEVSEEPWEPTI